MTQLLEQAGKAFLVAFGASLAVLLPGLLSAPNLGHTYAFGVAAFIASFVAGLKAVQVFIPQLTFSAYIPAPYGAWVDSFTRTFLSTLIVLLIPISNAPDLASGKGLVVAAVIGAFTAGFRALSGLLTPGESPLPAKGLRLPPEQVKTRSVK